MVRCSIDIEWNTTLLKGTALESVYYACTCIYKENARTDSSLDVFNNMFENMVNTIL